MPQITQAELEAVLTRYRELNHDALAIRFRLNHGAEVEPGKIVVESEGEFTPLDDGEVSGFQLGGLELGLELPKAKVAVEPQAETEAPALPEWLTEMPLDISYALAMDEGGLDAQECQRVEMTRKEYLILKVYLAKLRGIAVPTEKPEGFRQEGGTLNSLWFDMEPQEIASVPEVQ